MARVLERIDGLDYIFCPAYFKEAVDKYSVENDCTKNSVYDLIASKCGRSFDSVKDWTKVKKSGPSDKELLMSVATILNVDYVDLLCVNEFRSEINMNSTKVNVLAEKDVVRETYKLLLDLGYYYADTDGEYIPEHREIVNPIIINDYQKNRINLIKSFISQNALDISEEVWTKLSVIVNEMEMDILDNTPYRWCHFRNYNNAKTIRGDDLEDVLSDLGSENMYTEVYCYFAGKMQGGTEFDAETFDIENREYDYLPSEMYRWVFTELLIDLFKNDFPDLFSEEEHNQ